MYERDKTEAVEMWSWRRTIGTMWIEYTTTEAVLDERRTMTDAIMKRKIVLIGHLLRYNPFNTIIVNKW